MGLFIAREKPSLKKQIHSFFYHKSLLGTTQNAYASPSTSKDDRTFENALGFTAFKGANSRGVGYLGQLLRVGVSVKFGQHPIIVYSVANYRPHLSHFWANDQCLSCDFKNGIQCEPTVKY